MVHIGHIVSAVVFFLVSITQIQAGDSKTLFAKEASALRESLSISEDESSINAFSSIKKEVVTVESMQKTQSAEEEFVEFNFENADLSNLVKQIEDIFGVNFILDESIMPLQKDAAQKDMRAIKGNKITYRTQKPLSRSKAWDLFLTFLHMAGFAVFEHQLPRTYRITSIDAAKKSAIRVFIGTDFENLPKNDEIVRFIYFVDNSTVEAIVGFVDSIKSGFATVKGLPEHKALIITDKASNIRSIMHVVKELDKSAMPEVAVVIQLKQIDAKQVKDLYDSLLQTDDRGVGAYAQRKSPTTKFFPEGTKIIAYSQGNKLIVLGQKDKVAQIEDFITKYIDVEPSQSYSPFYVYPLKYADATTVANIMNEITIFGQDTEAGKSGGIRGADQYLKKMSFVPEASSNRIVIKGNYEDYLKAVQIIKQLDEPQAQISIEVLILAVTIDDQKSMGSQIRSKTPGGINGLIGNNVKFQTSGLFQTSQIVENKSATKGTDRLLGDLLNLVTGAQPGNAILALGSDLFGVWGIFQILETVTNAQVVSNPFFIATNKVPGTVSLGEIRRVHTANVISGSSTTDAFGDDPAALTVTITPQINSDGMILLEIDIQFDDFIDADPTSATKNTRHFNTSALVSDKQVLALGGLIRNKITSSMNKVPLIGDIPVLGWLFKNKQKTQEKQNLLILISSSIVEPNAEEAAMQFTNKHVDQYDGMLEEMRQINDDRDPIRKVFFDSKNLDTEKLVENYIFSRQDKDEIVLKRRKKRLARQRNRKKKTGDFNENKDTVVQSVPSKGQTDSLERKENKESESSRNSHKEEMTSAEIVHEKKIAEVAPFVHKIKQRDRTNLSLSNFVSVKDEA